MIETCTRRSQKLTSLSIFVCARCVYGGCLPLCMSGCEGQGRTRRSGAEGYILVGVSRRRREGSNGWRTSVVGKEVGGW